MSDPTNANVEKPVAAAIAPTTTVENVSGEISSETKPDGTVPSSSVAHENGVGKGVPSEQRADKSPEIDPADAAVESAKEQPENEEVQPEEAVQSEQEVQSPTNETNVEAQDGGQLQNGGGTGNVRIADDAKREDAVKGGVKPVRRSSTLSSIAQKVNPFYRPRGRIAKKSTSGRPHPSSGSGGCVIF